MPGRDEYRGRGVKCTVIQAEQVNRIGERSKMLVTVEMKKSLHFLMNHWVQDKEAVVPDVIWRKQQ